MALLLRYDNVPYSRLRYLYLGGGNKRRYDDGASHSRRCAASYDNVAISYGFGGILHALYLLSLCHRLRLEETARRSFQEDILYVHLPRVYILLYPPCLRCPL